MADTNLEIETGLVKDSTGSTISNHLHDLWTSIGYPGPLNFSVPYFTASNTRRPRIRQYLNQIWKSYLLNEHSDYTLFTQMERLKAIHWMGTSLFDLEKLTKFNQSNSKLYFDFNPDRSVKGSGNDIFFPLHDMFKLTGDQTWSWFATVNKEKSGLHGRSWVNNIEGSLKDLVHGNPNEIAEKQKKEGTQADTANLLSAAGNRARLVSQVDKTTGHRLNAKDSTYGTFITKPDKTNIGITI